MLCLQEEVHSPQHHSRLGIFCHVRRHEKIVTFEDLSDLHRLHLCACPICSRSDFQRVRFSTDVVRDAIDILTPSLWNHFEHAEIHFEVWMKENLTNKNDFILFLRKRECANASPSHQTNGQAGFICTLFMLCGFMYTLNVVWCVKSLVWFYVHFLCCAVYSVVLYTLWMLCGV